MTNFAVRHSPRAHALTTLSIIFAMALAAVVSWQIANTRERSLPNNASSLIQVDEWVSSGKSKAETYEAISRIAQQRHVTIYKVVPGGGEYSDSRDLFVFSANDKSGRVSDHEYHSFVPTFKTHLRSSSELTDQDMRGVYAFDSSSPELIAADFRKLGLSASQITVDSQYFVRKALLTNGLWIALAIGFIALALSIIFEGAKQVRLRAIYRIHGFSRFRATRASYVPLARTALASWLITAFISTVALFFYNRLAQWTVFAKTWLMISGIAALLALVIICANAMVMMRERPLDAIRGAKPNPVLQAASLLAKAACLALALMAISQSVSTFSQLRSEARYDAAWKRADGFVTTRFGGTVSEEEFQRSFAQFGQMERQLEDESQVVLSYHNFDPVVTTAAGAPFDVNNDNALVINHEYLRHNPVDNLPVNTASQRVQVIIPVSRQKDAAAISRGVADWLRFNAAPGFSDLATTFADAHDRTSRDLFAYATTSNIDKSGTKDPVVLYVPKAYWLKPEFLTSAATNGGLIFTEPDALRNAITAHGLGSHIPSVDKITDLAYASQNARRARWHVELFCILSSLLVAIVASSVLAAIYCLRSARRLFVCRIFGISAFETHGKYVAGEVVSMAVVVALFFAARRLDSLPSILLTSATCFVIFVSMIFFLSRFSRSSIMTDVRRS